MIKGRVSLQLVREKLGALLQLYPVTQYNRRE